MGDLDKQSLFPGQRLSDVAVLASGGLDSCVLVSQLAKEAEVVPLFVRAGLGWEEAELMALAAYLDATPDTNVASLQVLEIPVASLYGSHWSTTGTEVPGYDEPDSRVYLPGRNVLLLGFAAVWCALNDLHRLALGTLSANPFPDATPEFFARYSSLLSSSLSHEIAIEAPFRRKTKTELIEEFSALPLGLTLTCMAPLANQASASGVSHCGDCNKCHERQDAFRQARVPDPTPYAKETR